MVFVGMCKYNSLDLVCMLSEIRELREHKIDTGHIRLREHKPAVDKKNATLYLTGNNLLTFTKYMGYDPEFSAGNAGFAQGIDTGLDPLFRSVTLGIRIGL